MSQQRRDSRPHHYRHNLSEDLGSAATPSIVVSKEQPEQNAHIDAIRGNTGLELVRRTRQSAASEQTSVGHRNKTETTPALQCPVPGNSQAALRLDELLRSHFQTHPLPEVTDGYLPAGFLNRLVCRQTVRQELGIEFDGELDSDELDRLTDTVCGQPSYRQIFALLCLIEKLEFVREFLDPKTGVRDDDLPLQKVALNGRNIDLRKRSDPEVRLACFARWRHNSLKSFDDWQWTMNAPILARVSGSKAQHRKFDDRIILPLISVSSPSEGGNGGFSEVFQVQLHPRHHEFNRADANCFFALKKLRSTDAQAFQRELQNLRKFENDNSHKHLISLLTTWSQKGYFHFLFPWAECDLSKYWERKKKPVMTSALVRWVARQNTGMADGLTLIHDYPGQVDGTPENAARYGRHGDIKPENILWFKDLSDDQGTLVISDFGLGDFHSRATRSGIPSSDIARTPSYRPPECDVEGASISRSWDIWTLGCVYVEFATWLLGGWTLLEQFTDYRQTGSSIWGQAYMSDLFFDIVDLHTTGNKGMGAMIKPEVTRWFDGLHNHRKCTNYIHDLLILVQNEMLIVESISRKRATCKAVRDRLKQLEEKCLQDTSYCEEPVPWQLPESQAESTAVKINLNMGALDTIKRNHPKLRQHSGRTEEAPRERINHGNHLSPGVKTAIRK